MLLLGLLIVAGAVAFATVLTADNLGGGPRYPVSLFDHHLGTVNTLGAFLAGIALTLLCCLGLLMATTGARRELRRRTELRAARRGLRAAERTGDTVTAETTGTTVTTDTTGMTDTTEVPVVLTKRRSRARQLLGH